MASLLRVGGRSLHVHSMYCNFWKSCFSPLASSRSLGQYNGDTVTAPTDPAPLQSIHGIYIKIRYQGNKAKLHLAKNALPELWENINSLTSTMAPVVLSAEISQGNFIRFHSHDLPQSSDEDDTLILEFDTPVIPADDYVKMVANINKLHGYISKAFLNTKTQKGPEQIVMVWRNGSTTSFIDKWPFNKTDNDAGINDNPALTDSSEL